MRDFIHRLRAVLSTTRGHYPHLTAYLDDMEPEVLRDLHRLIQTMQDEARADARRAQREPWRRF